MRMKYRYIAESNDPFGILFESCKINSVNNAADAVTTPCTKNRFYIVVIKQLLKVFQPFFVCSGKIMVLPANGCSHFGCKSPIFVNDPDTFGNLLYRHETRRTSNTDTVLFLQIWG